MARPAQRTFVERLSEMPLAKVAARLMIGSPLVRAASSSSWVWCSVSTVSFSASPA